MKDFLGAFSSDFLKPLATLIFPGLLAITPWAIAAVCQMTWLSSFVAQNPGEAVGALTAIAIFLGLILEDVGARIEYVIYSLICKWDTRFSEDKDWYPYLRKACRIEPVGHRYLRTLVLRLKFELGCSSALPFAVVGVWFLPLTHGQRVWTSFGLVTFGAYMLFEAITSVKNTATVRLKLLT